MEIITLIENGVSQAHPKLKAEAGLSLFIKTESKNILFDTGISGAFADNAEKLGVDLKNVDFVVISHGHYDHTGGLKRFFEINDKAKVYIHEKAGGDYYYKVLFLKKYIGTDKKMLDKYNDRFVFVNGDFEIENGIRLISNFTSNYPVPSDSKHILTKKDNKYMIDNFAHEQMLLIENNDFMFCFTGCSHHGIANMVETAQSISNNKKLIVIGGFHMYNPLTKGLSEKPERIKEIANLFNKNKNIESIATGHCTGKKAFEILKTILGNKLISINTGTKIEF